MKRSYLEEDLSMIQKYFPGARSTTIRTPFDLTQRDTPMSHLEPDSFHDTTEPGSNWIQDVLWTN